MMRPNAYFSADGRFFCFKVIVDASSSAEHHPSEGQAEMVKGLPLLSPDAPAEQQWPSFRPAAPTWR